MRSLVIHVTSKAIAGVARPALISVASVVEDRWATAKLFPLRMAWVYSRVLAVAEAMLAMPLSPPRTLAQPQPVKCLAG